MRHTTSKETGRGKKGEGGIIRGGGEWEGKRKEEGERGGVLIPAWDHLGSNLGRDDDAGGTGKMRRKFFPLFSIPLDMGYLKQASKGLRDRKKGRGQCGQRREECG